MKNIFFAFTILSYSAIAQVGINNPLPDSSTVLDLSGPNNNGRGLLIPTTIDLLNAVPNTSNGLLIRDSTLNEIYIRFELDNKWQAVNPWRQEYNSTNIYTIGKNVGIGVQNPTTPLDVLGNVNFSGDLAVSGTVTARKFVGDGIVPRGGIIMWSGTTPPAGWVLCDGRHYNSNGTEKQLCPPLMVCPSAHIKTPNLMGKFVVGYDTTSTDYINPGNKSDTLRDLVFSFAIVGGGIAGQTGGEESTQLTIANLPSHRHSISNDGAHVHSIGNSGDGFLRSDQSGAEIREYSTGQDRVNYQPISQTNNSGSHNHGGNTGYQGSNQAHENRPPYYVLAYIMKL